MATKDFETKTGRYINDGKGTIHNIRGNVWKRYRPHNGAFVYIGSLWCPRYFTRRQIENAFMQ